MAPTLKLAATLVATLQPSNGWSDSHTTKALRNAAAKAIRDGLHPNDVRSLMHDTIAVTRGELATAAINAILRH